MAPSDLEDSPHRGFYDRLRRRMSRSLLEERGLAPGTVEALLLAPDLFVLLVRLSLDPRVKAADRALIGSALLYFVAPFDLVPEALLGAGGFVDDVVLAATILAHVLGPDLEDVAARHWSGSTALRETLSRRGLMKNSRGAQRRDLRSLFLSMPRKWMRCHPRRGSARTEGANPCARSGLRGAGRSSARRTLNDGHRIAFAHGVPNLDPRRAN